MNGWKIVGIIFIIIALLEGAVIYFFIDVGLEVIRNENECAYDICLDYEQYGYDVESNVCSCYTEGQLVKSERLK